MAAFNRSGLDPGFLPPSARVGRGPSSRGWVARPATGPGAGTKPATNSGLWVDARGGRRRARRPWVLSMLLAGNKGSAVPPGREEAGVRLGGNGTTELTSCAGRPSCPGSLEASKAPRPGHAVKRGRSSSPRSPRVAPLWGTAIRSVPRDRRHGCQRPRGACRKQRSVGNSGVPPSGGPDSESGLWPIPHIFHRRWVDVTRSRGGFVSVTQKFGPSNGPSPRRAPRRVRRTVTQTAPGTPPDAGRWSVFPLTPSPARSEPPSKRYSPDHKDAGDRPSGPRVGSRTRCSVSSGVSSGADAPVGVPSSAGGPPTATLGALASRRPAEAADRVPCPREAGREAEDCDPTEPEGRVAAATTSAALPPPGVLRTLALFGSLAPEAWHRGRGAVARGLSLGATPQGNGGTRSEHAR